MGIFFNKSEAESAPSQAEVNEARLKSFKPTKALGVKKYEDAMLFIFDEEKKLFCVVEGPEEAYQDKNPVMIKFSEAYDVYLQVNQYWTEKKNQGEDEKGAGKLSEDRFGEVFWHYDLYMNILTKKEGCEHIRYKMNYNTTVIKVPSRDGERRGLALNGLIRGKGFTQNIKRLESWVEQDEFEGSDLEKKNIAKINVIITHLKRARKINKLLG